MLAVVANINAVLIAVLQLPIFAKNVNDDHYYVVDQGYFNQILQGI